ncbi:hypothetical protein HPB49_008830 [Dermacentor silvarum]|uniref:Uncharacterized protein n=1 Tax=Dermacentor silvarum TaxID=543639 RepID=A0ACB8DXY6_DERSI|nr:hypothetical protein HPB49_008830 [Dermacentor silvarum]
MPATKPSPRKFVWVFCARASVATRATLRSHGHETHVKQSKKRKRSVYIAPCGTWLRDITKVAHYLNLCKSLLTVDLFCFDSLANVFCEFVTETLRTFVENVTYGKQQVPVTSVNSVDDVYPTFLQYSSKRGPGKGMELNLDPDFLCGCGCDCDDDCQGGEKCSCQQLKIAATEALTTGGNPNAGYHYRRLQEPHITGVYECNSQCHCSRRRYNSVVQNGLHVRLQVFKTEKRCGGIRCVDYLPQGSFICVYFDQLLNRRRGRLLLAVTDCPTALLLSTLSPRRRLVFFGTGYSIAVSASDSSLSLIMPSKWRKCRVVRKEYNKIMNELGVTQLVGLPCPTTKLQASPLPTVLV